MAKVFIVMGVSGSGKTTIGKTLADKLNIPFYDADDFHFQSNINKMKNGHALNDDDRQPWLELLSNKLEQWEQTTGAVLACSSLKESYRKILAIKVKNLNWVYLKGSFSVIEKRMNNREDHYMKSTLLQSQFDALEEPSYGLHLDIVLNKKDIINHILLNQNK